jgi:transposase
MKPQTYRVCLSGDERQRLTALLRGGIASARTLRRARTLLKSDRNGPAWTDPQIADALGCSVSTVSRTRKRYAAEGLDAALAHRPTSRVYERALDGAAEARLIQLACSQPPQGRARWTLELLAERMVRLGHVGALSRETVRRTLKKNRSALT